MAEHLFSFCLSLSLLFFSCKSGTFLARCFTARRMCTNCGLCQTAWVHEWNKNGIFLGNLLSKLGKSARALLLRWESQSYPLADAHAYFAGSSLSPGSVGALVPEGLRRQAWHSLEKKKVREREEEIGRGRGAGSSQAGHVDEIETAGAGEVGLGLNPVNVDVDLAGGRWHPVTQYSPAKAEVSALAKTPLIGLEAALFRRNG